jgi:flagellar motor switch protein FliG
MSDNPLDPNAKNETAGPGAQKAAALLLGLGPDIATSIFQQLTESEVRHIALGAKQLRKLPPSTVPDALRQFVEALEKVGGDAAAGDDMLREIASKALGSDVVRRAFDGVIPPPPADEMLGSVANADPESLAMVLAREQPQTVALVLSAISPERAAQVMDFIPEHARGQIIRRMAVVESVAPEVLREVRQALAAELQALMAEGMRKVDGKSAALQVLRRSPSAQQAEVLSAIEKDDPTLAGELRTKLFTFEDLGRLADRDVQQLLKDVDLKQLAIALKGGSGMVKEKFLKNMSTRAAESLAEDLGSMGPVRLSNVEEAQGSIAKTAVELAEKGRITIVRPTDKML